MIYGHNFKRLWLHALFVHLLYVDICRCKLLCAPDVFWLKNLFKHASKFARNSACPGRVSYIFRISSRRVTGALNTL